jgi:xanthine/CO dehydrogenase XdhC/CoxF family maturation factor
LEAEVASRAWWLSAEGPCIQHYSTAEDDGDRPFGSGCGGVVYLLLERRATAQPFLAALQTAFAERAALSVATVVEGPSIGQRSFAGLAVPPPANSPQAALPSASGVHALQALADSSLNARASMESKIEVEGRFLKTWVNFRPARPGLAIFGAGDDARPLLRIAKGLGWFTTVSDGRSHLVTRDRFAAADRLSTLPIPELLLPSNQPIPEIARIQPDDAVVVMTHSFEQDSKILACLLQLEPKPAYIGVLGPQRRTLELLAEAARLLRVPEADIPAQVDRWMSRLHAPTGLDLGAEAPESIALSILAEIQKQRSDSTGKPLRELRSATSSVTP